MCYEFEMKEADTLQRFIFEHANIRGEIVHIEKTFQNIMNQRDYPPMVKNLLGEALVSCLLLASSIKFEGNLSLQFQGDERLSLLLVQCDHNLNIRGFAKCAEGLEIADYATAFLQGRMVITLSQDNQTQAYQSLIPIQSTSMSENLMTYFAQSEQIATRVWLAVNEDMAAGMLLQLMPGQDTIQREQFWEYAVQLGQTVTEDELLTIDNQTLLYRLYHETELRIFESRSTRFQCRCNQDKMKQVITVLGEEEATDLIKEKGKIEITCDFCNQKYTFDSIDVTLLFRK
ncbi:TPA: Hsp33 family molecular chaperone HslO [Legionella pneumophila]|uniref:Hsp33 family molecular chaperone HslO n=2 Tax=Legionella pneumophila TaxID=446 RepID=A0A3A6VIR5_LEGPN|nr:redox-regulated molecular chaperone Hsp33 [Legionella pneumophila]RJY27601.1 Hsp33 family molecular chaperone HslO [Legionella pneumophila subsp. pneumophila]PQM70369.1 redox-regulated molecular chaperone Hsp33 [Legionella pneumophila]PYB44730.1 Hsp33 family molecular chaperone HslO [Legionella pneumophila]PYB47807.1 Hsp33 family molecular chaperone HslO [Legionella pneumophila]